MKKLIALLSCIVLIAGTLSAETVEQTYHFANPKIVEMNGYQMITFDKTLPSGITGEPMLPYHSVALLLPPGHTAKDVEIIKGNEIILSGTYVLYPKQYVQPVSKGKSGKFAKNEALYQRDIAYPESLSGTLSTQFMNGYAVAMSAFTPVRYNPASGVVSYYETITVRITTVADTKASEALSNLNSSPEVMKRVNSLVQNREDVSQYPQNSARTEDYDMVIITPGQFEDEFQELISFYEPRGIVTKVATTESIYASTPGTDNPMKIRNYIIQEYQDHGIQHVFLGGDVEYVPYRGFYCHVQSSSVYEDENIPSDLYFSALDGNWNTNGNNRWGEIGEDDLLPEVGVARFSFSSQAELTKMIHKTTSYQGDPVMGEFRKPLLAGEFLYSNPETWGSDYLELLIGHRTDNGYETTGIPEDDDIERLYDENGSWSVSTLLQKINSGKSFIHHCGHANSDYTMKLYNSDITNANFANVNGIIHNYTLAYSHGCICGAFDDNDCIAERMINIDNFAVSVVMNSRYGWFNEGQTEGPSAHLHREFADAIYFQKQNIIGMAHTISRIETSPWVNAPGQWEEGALRWCFYDCNVLGDAGLRIWTSDPITITANYQNALPIGVPSVSIAIASNGAPVDGLSCVFMMDGVNYGMATTNASGQAEITFTAPIPNVGDAIIYVSGYNCQLHEFPVSVIPNAGAYVVYASSEVHDVNGNNNGIPEYNESVTLSTALKNVGTVQANNVTAMLSSADSYVTITDNTEVFGNIAGGATITIEDAFAFDIAGNVPDQHAVSFNILATGQDSWSSDFSVIVRSPALNLGGFTINDNGSGNNNGLLDPGETADVLVEILNEGGASAFEVIASLTTGSQYITVNTTTPQEIGDLNAGGNSVVSFSVTASAGIPAGHIANFQVQIEAMYGIEVTGTFAIPFVDYCEATTEVEDEYISNVNFGSISNSSGWQGGVANYTNLSATLQPGASQQIVVTNGNAWASDIVVVWIDWNRNMEFGSSPSETYQLTNVGGTGASFQGNITVPANQASGQYRMRIRMTYSTAPEPCGSATYGEIEDYSVMIAGGTLTVNVTSNPGAICQGESSQLTAIPSGGTGVYTYSWTPQTGLNNPNIYNPVATPLVTTTYTVQVSDGTNTISGQTTVTVNPLPATPVIQLNGNILSSSSATGNQWYDSQGMIPGATGQTYTCTYEDDYYVIVTNQFGCASAPSNVIHVVITGIVENSDSNWISVYPNPFTEKTLIKFNVASGSSYTLAVYNALGETVRVLSEGMSDSVGAQNIEFDAAHIEKGIYFCKLITGENIIIRKLICTK